MASVLVADDSPLVRVALKKRLAAAGLAVREAESAAESGGISADEVGCAVLDLDLGDGDGVTVAKGLRARDAALPIAFFTSGTTDAMLAEAQAIGPVFHKPDEIDGVVAWARAALSPRHGR
jgi:DNA-binding response OmpR family regulator